MQKTYHSQKKGTSQCTMFPQINAVYRCSTTTANKQRSQRTARWCGIPTCQKLIGTSSKMPEGPEPIHHSNKAAKPTCKFNGTHHPAHQIKQVPCFFVKKKGKKHTHPRFRVKKIGFWSSTNQPNKILKAPNPIDDLDRNYYLNHQTKMGYSAKTVEKVSFLHKNKK